MLMGKNTTATRLEMRLVGVKITNHLQISWRLNNNPRFILHGVSTTDFIGTIVSEYYFSGEIQKKLISTEI